MRLLAYLEKQSQLFKIIIGFGLIGTVGFLDFLTGYELAFSLFYILPVSFLTWLISRRAGITAALVSALVWFAADRVTGHSYSHPLIPIWNTLIRFSFFVTITLLLSSLRRAMEREKELARIDSLTGAVNSRHFLELVQEEINRSRRYEHPFTLVYLDLDNFKMVNDRFGHAAGDEVLYTIVDCVKRCLRKTDVIARLGGDEFALLLPETGQEETRTALSKLQAGLLEEMQHNHWPITFSIGVLTCSAASLTVDELLKMADHLMYSVKHDSKNAIQYAAYPSRLAEQ